MGRSQGVNRNRHIVLASCAAALSLTACSEGCQRLDPATPGQRKTIEAVRGLSPMTQAELPTMEPKLALARLDEVIQKKSEGVANNQLEPLIDLTMHLTIRGHLLGRISDLERAAELSQKAIVEAPADPRGYLRHAQVDVELRRLPEAEQLLIEAERRNGEPKTIAGTRARILRVTERYEEAQALLRERNEESADIYSLGAEAMVTGSLGNLDLAEELFARAQHFRPDSSPFPLAWLYYQQGMMWLGAGKRARAIELLTASHERLPQYPRPVAALAPLLFEGGRREEALALLRPIAETAEDPECAGVLAELLARAGRDQDAERWRTLAAARFEQLYAAHPELVADRAARFWLRVAKQPEKAVAPAIQALEVYNDGESLMVALEASLAANDAAAACRLANRAPALGPKLPTKVLPLVERARATCSSVP